MFGIFVLRCSAFGKMESFIEPALRKLGGAFLRFSYLLVANLLRANKKKKKKNLGIRSRLNRINTG